MRTILVVIAGLASLAGQPAVAQQGPAEPAPAASPGAAPAAPEPAQAGVPEGERNPAAGTASGCGTTGAELAKTPVMVNPCPEYPTQGSGQSK